MIPTEYSEAFEKERKYRLEVSYHKYGSARDNFGGGRVDALATGKDVEEDGNKEKDH